MTFKYQHIHILGASGSGTTTLGEALSGTLQYTHFDSDNYYWKTKFTEPRLREERVQNLSCDLHQADRWILSGAVIDWGNPLIPLFDLVIFISVPNELRMKRLEERERLRYDSAIDQDGSKHKEFIEFMEWANCYETGGMDVRSRTQQRQWLQKLSCRVIELDAEKPVDELIEAALLVLRQ